MSTKLKKTTKKKTEQNQKPEKQEQITIPKHLFDDLMDKASTVLPSGRKYNRSTLAFTNKDCMTCFAFIERELHYLLNKIIPKNKTAPLFFRKENYASGGAGKHRFLTYYEFYLIGLLKLLNFIGLTYEQGMYIVFSRLLEGRAIDDVDFSSYLISVNKFYIHLPSPLDPTTLQSPRSKNKTVDLIFSTKDPSLSKAPPLYHIEVDLMSFNEHVFKYLETYYKQDYAPVVKTASDKHMKSLNYPIRPTKSKSN